MKQSSSNYKIKHLHHYIKETCCPPKTNPKNRRTPHQLNIRRHLKRHPARHPPKTNPKICEPSKKGTLNSGCTAQEVVIHLGIWENCASNSNMDWSKVVRKTDPTFKASIPWIEAGVSASLVKNRIDANLGFQEVQAARILALCRSGVSPTAHIDEENPPDRTLGSGLDNQQGQRALELWFQSSSLEYAV